MAKVMVSIPEDLLAEIDREAQQSGRTRSELLEYIMRRYLSGEEPPYLPPGERPAVRAATARMKAILERHPELADTKDATTLVREDRDSH